MIVQCSRCHLRHDLTGRPPDTEISCRCGAPLRLPPDGGETAALTCPQCGGQADNSLARCQHCDSALATVRCPTCFGLAFDGNVHCSHCGGSLEAPGVVTHETGRQPLPCPTCRTDLDATVIDKTLIDLCADCGGVWLDHAAFEKLIHDKKFVDLASALNIPGWTAQQATVLPSEKESPSLYDRRQGTGRLGHRRRLLRRYPRGSLSQEATGHGQALQGCVQRRDSRADNRRAAGLAYVGS